MAPKNMLVFGDAGGFCERVALTLSNTTSVLAKHAPGQTVTSEWIVQVRARRSSCLLCSIFAPHMASICVRGLKFVFPCSPQGCFVLGTLILNRCDNPFE